MKYTFLVTLQIETILNKDELCFAHDDNLGIIDGDTEIKGFIATSKVNLGKKISPEKNYEILKKGILNHIKQIKRNMLQND